MKELLNIQQVANTLNVSVPTVYRWTQQRKIDFIKLGGRVLFTEEALENFITKSTVRAGR